MKIISLILLVFSLPGFSQNPANLSEKAGTMGGTSQSASIRSVDLHSKNSFIQNIGQYNDNRAVFQKMGAVQYGFEGLDMPVLFTSKGIIHLQRKIERETEERNKKKATGEEDEHEVKVTDKIITMEWLGANEQVQIIAEEPRKDYHTYGLLQTKAYGYGKLTYKALYPGIDVVYNFTDGDKQGFEYSIIVHPGADPSLIQMKYGGDVKKIRIENDGTLVVASAINGITESKPLSFTRDNESEIAVTAGHLLESSSFLLQDKVIGFSIPDYNKTQTLVIDPFVSNTLNLTGINSGKAKDIDFDYDGNVYVTGGGDGAIQKLAKYDPAGTLLWTFSGSLTVPSWTFGSQMGGWVVEKTSGKTYLGQGVNVSGSRIIRLDAAGLYDNYITNVDPGFWENWKMLWLCNNGTPQIVVTGGGITTNINLAICTPPSPAMVGTNMTGILGTYAQDIVDIVVDPANNEVYSIFASLVLTPFVNNRIYKHSAPYGGANIQWQRYSGYTSLMEVANRPYLSGAENSANVFAVNSSYLFYWDGYNLKAFHKNDGSDAGFPATLAPNLPMRQGGIYADECNNVFIGNTNGTIKVFKFDGISFDDAAAPDITIPDNPTANVYDMAYDDARQLLYASGNGFVGAFDVSSYCGTAAVYTLSVVPDCPTLSAQASISPAPPVGTPVTYALFNGATQVASNSTGFFSGLTPSVNYTIKAYLNQACSGIQLLSNFNLGACGVQVIATKVNPSCHGFSNGSITATGVNGIPAYQYSIDGINFQPSGFFGGLPAGNYTITVKDAASLTATTNVILTDPLLLQISATTVDASCSNPTGGSITATGTGGIAPLQYSIDGINFQGSGSFTGLGPANYTVTVKDANNCTAIFPLTIDLPNTAVVDAGNNFTICEGTARTMSASSNGNSFVWTPATGLSDPFILNPVASPVVTTVYTLKATDANLCSKTSSVKVIVDPAPVPNAGPDAAVCFGNSVQLNGSGGVTYQWRPVSFLSAYNISNPVVTNPGSGSITYFLTVTGSNGCSSVKPDAVTVKVSKPAKVFAGNDTIVAINQYLRLFAVDVNHLGFTNYSWSPVYGLNDALAQSPVAQLDRDITYTVQVKTAEGCIGSDDIRVKVYKGPEIYVPNAFTPNNDQLNDIMKAIPVGIADFHYFRIFNRYGQLVFSTANPANGWDGIYQGVQQGTATFVWMAEAVDYLGNVLRRKGTFVLLR